ncbi:MAG TPA: peptide deformylase [Patescibacteria group bacterium]|nr:peptide deformylase [Patescibacteria group bacterium]
MTAKSSFRPKLPIDLYALTALDIERYAGEQTLGMRPPIDPLLGRAIRPVAPQSIAESEVQSLIVRLIAVASGQQQSGMNIKTGRMLVGLAAPQVGEDWQIIVIDTKVRADRKKPGKLEAFINPEIIWRSRETEEAREGCFSAGPVWGLVRRSVAVKIRALSVEGKPVERIFEGFTARIVQHEIDHLHGVRFPDRIKSDKKRHWVHSEELADYPEHIHHWPRLCSVQRWEDFKHGTIKP